LNKIIYGVNKILPGLNKIRYSLNKITGWVEHAAHDGHAAREVMARRINGP